MTALGPGWARGGGAPFRACPGGRGGGAPDNQESREPISLMRWALRAELSLRQVVVLGRADGVGERQHFDEHHAIDGVDVVHIHVAGMSFERVVEVLVNERQHVRLLHGHHVVGVDRFGRVDAAQFFVEGERLFGGGELVAGHLVEAAFEVSLEGKPHCQGEKVAESERGLVERTTEGGRHSFGDGRLRGLEAGERLVQFVARDLVFLSEIRFDLAEHTSRYARVQRHRSNRSTPYPHLGQRSTSDGRTPNVEGPDRADRARLFFAWAPPSALAACRSSGARLSLLVDGLIAHRRWLSLPAARALFYPRAPCRGNEMG